MKRGLGRRLGTAGVLIAGLSFARLAHGGGSPAFSPIVEEHRLANGLRVVLAPDDALSDVSVVVRYEAGRGDDPDGKEGLAHVTEHVLFGAFRQGAHAKLLLQAGASNVNAGTAWDSTSYQETVPPAALDLALWLEGARMATAADAVDEGVVMRERTVAGHEYRISGYLPDGFDEVGLLFDVPWNELYPKWHPYHLTGDAIGAMSGVGPADVRAFAETWYGPNNASVVVAGHFDAGRALEQVQKYFGGIAARPVPSRPALPALPAPGNLWLDVEALVTHPVAMMAWRGPASHAPEEPALTVAARLVSTLPLAVDRGGDGGGVLRVVARDMPAALGSVFAVVIEPRAGVSLAEVLPRAQAAMAALPDRLTDADLARVKKRLSDADLVDLETSMARAYRVADPRGRTSLRNDDYDGVDRASVVDSMRRFLAPEQRVTMVVRPTTRALYGALGVVLHRDRMAR